MSIKLPVALLALSLLCSPVLAADKKGDAGITIEPQGLRIVKPVSGAKEDGTGPARPFNWSPGTTVSLGIQSPKGGIISIDRERSEVTLFVDDKKTDLSKPVSKNSFHDKAQLGNFPNISADGKSCALELDAPGIPAVGATQLFAKGKIVLTTATIAKDFTAESVALKPGTVIKAGAIPLTIKSAGKPNWGDMALQVSLEASQDLANIKDIQFFNAAGKKIESQSAGGGSMGMFGKTVSVTRDYTLKEKVDTVKIVITYWMDAKTMTVPLDLKMGIGF